VTGYPEQIGALLERGYQPLLNATIPHTSWPFDTVNYAVGGATTATLIAVQLPKAVALMNDRRGDRDPFNDVEVLSVTIGGNDVFGPAVASCVLTTNPTGCQPRIDAVLAATRANLHTIVSQLTAAAGRRAEIVLTTYYNPIASCDLTRRNPAAPTIADVVLEGGTQPGLLTVADGLNDVIRQVAAANRIQVTDLYGRLGPDQYVGGSDCLHPNLAGHTTIAELVNRTLARPEWLWPTSP
jgi:lysophospholipase L1-like esterase